MSESHRVNVRQLFVVVSTGAGVANIPPVLERKKQGDRIVWLESSRAKARGWTNGPREVLARYGFADQLTIDIPDEPDAIVETVTGETVASQLAVEGCKLVLVAN